VRDADRVRVAAGRDEVHDVALGHDPRELLALLEHDHRRDPVRPHDLGDVGEGVLVLRRLHVRPHDVADQHVAASLVRDRQPTRGRWAAADGRSVA
jgi:hypothetical protein